jgi:hypothetical protein
MKHFLPGFPGSLFLLASLFGVTLAAAQPAGRPRPQEGALKAGDPAPDFALKRLLSDAEKEAAGKDAPKPKPVRLSDFKGKRPVVLIFGSYT